jgi:hypothetical protein
MRNQIVDSDIEGGAGFRVDCSQRFSSVPFYFVVAMLFAFSSHAAETFSLQGKWSFGIDREDRGLGEQWFSHPLPDKINLPGVLQSQGFGDEISIKTPWVLSLYDRLWYLREDYQAYTNAGSVKVPFVCQPSRHYLGAAWYQREIEIPKDWDGRRVVLFLERPHWESQVWLDDQLIGTNNSLCVPHEFELGVVASRSDAPRSGITPGKHKLTVRVDNRLILPYRPDAHSVSDSLSSTWNGIVGKMELRSTPAVWIQEVRVFPEVEKKSARLKIKIGNVTGRVAQSWIGVWNGATKASQAPEVARVVQSDASTDAPEPKLPPPSPGSSASPIAQHGEVEMELSLGSNPQTWDEFTPVVQRIFVELKTDAVYDSQVVTFGLRDFLASGNQFILNGRETFLRGTHHGGDFPLTGYPPTDVQYWRKLIRVCKEWGLNHMRFHSFCPPEAAFEAADELGFYLQPEPGMWNTFDPGSPMEKMLYLETERIIKAYGNHPSFVMLSPSNEPKGRWKQVLPQWAEHFRSADPRRLYTSGTGFTDADAPGPLEKVDFITTQRFGQRRVRGEPGWFGRDYSSSLEGVNVPVISHETGQWCAYPDYDVIKKFTGYMRPGNYEIFRDSLAAHGLLVKNKDFAAASGRFQLACYKEEIEAALRTPKLAGFQLLDLHDYVGQGTALVGLLDPFWESKGCVKADEFRKFCNTTVPLARLESRTFTPSDAFNVEVEVAHYGGTEITNAMATWEIKNQSGQTVVQGHLATKTIPIGRSALGKISADVSKLPAPHAYKLVVKVGQASSLSAERSRANARADFENDWKFWLYPARDLQPVPQDVFVTRSWEEAEPKLVAGGKVLFVPRNADLDWTSPPLDTVPVFWNRLMNPAWGRMLGLWCDTNHPALAGFPTEANCDWQWTQIIRGVRPVNLDRLPRGLQPIVQAIDDWNRNWKLGAIFECRVGAGRLMVSSFDITADLQEKPAARQLLRSLLDYMASERFQPRTEVSATEIQAVLFDTRIMCQLEAKAEGEGNAASAIDGDPNTYWLAGGSGRNASGVKHPHELKISFPKSVAMTGVNLMPRQNDRDHLGDVRGYKIEISDDGLQWMEISHGELPSSWNPRRIEFGRTVSARQIRFTALSGFGGDSSAALAEFAVIYAGPKLADDGAATIEYRRSRSTSADVDEGGGVLPISTNAVPRHSNH